MKGKKKILLEDSFYDQFVSPIPPHLSPEEREQWEKQLEWEKQELERRKREGFWTYPYSDSN
jgi:hypothetical protein